MVRQRGHYSCPSTQHNVLDGVLATVEARRSFSISRSQSMTRRMSAKRRAAVFAAHDGLCHICEGKIGVGEAWEVEHRIPLEISGDDSDGNLAPAHIACHRAKTKGDAH